MFFVDMQQVACKEGNSIINLVKNFTTRNFSGVVSVKHIVFELSQIKKKPRML